MFKSYTINTNATDQTPGFPRLAGTVLTIHHAAVGSTPTGTFTLEVYNESDDSWDTVSDASSAFTNPAAGDSGGVANFSNAPGGVLRVVYTASSGGAASGGTVVVYQE